MSYRILLNKTRKEAFLISDDSENEEEEDREMKNITKMMRSYAAKGSSLSWTFEDDIVLWETNTICYYTLQEYHELNFITYNKEAHFT